MDTFKELPKLDANSFDLVLTDPPYDLSESEQDWLLDEFKRVSKTGVIVFCSPENQWPQADQYLFWMKSISTKNTSRRYSRFVEMILVYGDVKWNTDLHWSQYTNIFTDLVDDSKLHPFRKPPSLIERLVRTHSDGGDKILDPFAGSGVIGDVCKAWYRECVSFEAND